MSTKYLSVITLANVTGALPTGSAGDIVYRASPRPGFYGHDGTSWRRLGQDGAELVDSGANGDLTYDNAGDGYTALDPDGNPHVEFTTAAAVYIEGILAPGLDEPTELTLSSADGPVYVYHLAPSAAAADQIHLSSFAGGGPGSGLAGRFIRLRYSRSRAQWVLAGYPT